MQLELNTSMPNTVSCPNCSTTLDCRAGCCNNCTWGWNKSTNSDPIVNQPRGDQLRESAVTSTVTAGQTVVNQPKRNGK